MRCFRHADTEAVGVCGGCLKGVCPACAKESAHGMLACSDACVLRIEEAEQWRDKLQSARTQQRVNIWLGPTLYIAMGALFAAYGFQHAGYSLDLATVMGLLFIVYGAAYGWRMRQWSRRQLH